MLIEHPPTLYRRLFPGAIWKGAALRGDGKKMVYLTFDDGPVPEVTPLVLDILDRKGVKATFFMVADNVRRHPELLEQVMSRGHAVGNHSMHHLQGLKTPTSDYIADIEEAAKLIPGRLYRPPHGLLRRAQLRQLRQMGYDIIMYDVVTRDYSQRLTATDVVRNVERYVAPGSIIVFHDSVKAAPRMLEALPRTIDLLRSQGYDFGVLDCRTGS